MKYKEAEVQSLLALYTRRKGMSDFEFEDEEFEDEDFEDYESYEDYDGLCRIDSERVLLYLRARDSDNPPDWAKFCEWMDYEYIVDEEWSVVNMLLLLLLREYRIEFPHGYNDLEDGKLHEIYQRACESVGFDRFEFDAEEKDALAAFSIICEMIYAVNSTIVSDGAIYNLRRLNKDVEIHLSNLRRREIEPGTVVQLADLVVIKPNGELLNFEDAFNADLIQLSDENLRYSGVMCCTWQLFDAYYGAGPKLATEGWNTFTANAIVDLACFPGIEKTESFTNWSREGF